MTEQQQDDMQRIAAYLFGWEAFTYEQVMAIAELVVTQPNYDRTQPINGNRIAGIEFDIPAPAEITGDF